MLSMEVKDASTFSSQLLSVVCHDLASPLMVVSLNLEKLKFELTQNKGFDFTSSMESIDRSQQAIKKVNFVLELARSAHGLSQGKIPVANNHVSIRQCFISAIQLVESAAIKKNVKIEFLEWPTIDTTVTDETLLTQHILVNLLTNAIKFSFRDGKILISAQKKSDCFLVYISDSGVGMPKEKLKTIFEFNITTSSRGTENEVGTGYGLPIVKFFIDMIGAEMQVFSRQKTDLSPYSGTLFEIKIPIKTINS